MSPCHHHTHTATSRTFALAILLNGGLTLLQAVYACLTHSNSLLADAGHNLGDVLALLFSWLAVYLSTKSRNERYSYGYKKSTLLASLLSAALLLVTSTLILAEAGSHLLHPHPVDALPVILVAGLGILVNGGSALLFFRKSHKDLNLRASFLHLLFDALTSLSVVLGATLIYFTHLNWVDPLLGIVITLFILKGSIGLFKQTLDLSLDGVPQTVDYSKVLHYLSKVQGVVKVHDLHIWALSTTETALTAHILRPEGNFDRMTRQQISTILRERFHITHTTLQIEEHLDEECEHEQHC